MTTRVLIVDDSATIRHLLGVVLSRDPEIEVLGGAPDAASARAMIKELNPDVITLDIEMPNMNGLEFLDRIMRLRPMPVVMVSTLTQRGSEMALTALEIGAIDYFPKPADHVAQNLEVAGTQLAQKIKAAAKARVRSRSNRPRPTLQQTESYDPGPSVVAIGSSTGGVEALIEVLSQFPENCPPTLITQHMPAHFTATFADRLDRLCKPCVREARDGALLAPGHIFLAPGTVGHLEVSGVEIQRCRLVPGDPVCGHRPSVDVLFHSMARTLGSRGVGVILTGMGCDGAAGLKAMREAGARTIGQDEATSVVYGMPRVAFEHGSVERQLSIHAIGPEILESCRRCEEGRVHYAVGV